MTSPFRPDIFRDRVVFVTGGATGIGFGICEAFGLHGAKIAIMGRRKEVLDKAVAQLTAKGISAIAIQGDVRMPEAQAAALVDQIVQKFGRIDVLVNNAAGNFTCAAEDLSAGGFKTVNEIDVQGCFNMCKACLPHLKKTGAESGALIINITATLQYHGTPFQVHAASAKAGIDVITNTLGVEWGEYGIRVVGIAPGPIAGTEGGPTGRVFGGLLGGDTSRESLLRVVPLGRFGTVKDIANAALFLASDAGGFITAETVVVDGGQWHGTSMMYQMGKAFVARKKDEEKAKRATKSKL